MLIGLIYNIIYTRLLIQLKIFLLVKAYIKNKAIKTFYILLVCKLISLQTYTIAKKPKLILNNYFNKQ